MFLSFQSNNLSCPHLPNDGCACTNSFHNSNFTTTHAMVIEAFHWTVGGHMFKHVKIRNDNNMTCQSIIGSKVALKPSLVAPNQTIKAWVYK